MKLELLDSPFPAQDIEWRIQQAGKNNSGIWVKVLAYVTNRAIMKRLDEVCGKSGWCNEYRDIPNNGGVECGLSIKVDDEWITKWDAAEKTQVEAVKGGRSGAMKRAAVQWGIGRYLYDIDVGFATVSDKKLPGFCICPNQRIGIIFSGNRQSYQRGPSLLYHQSRQSLVMVLTLCHSRMNLSKRSKRQTGF
ncbi:DNA damage response protein A [Raoultella planticola]|nr:DNA damage response protein A [Raoultella planticola]